MRKASPVVISAPAVDSFIVPMLEDIARILAMRTDSGVRLGRALECVAQHMGMMRGAISLVPLNAKDLHIEIAFGHKPAELSRGHYAPGEGITGMVIQSGKGLWVPDVSNEPLFLNRTRARNLHKDNSSFFCVPLTLADEAIGAMSVERRGLSSALGKEYLRVLHIVAFMLAPCAREHQSLLARPAAQQEVEPSGAVPFAAAQNPLQMVGNAPALQMIFAQIAQVASSPSTVLVRGESGTGKELVAKAIHDASLRSKQAFISLNCAALPENLIESELFGHERGAFTGAATARKGRFELAEGGTLFLDEVGDLSLVTQAKLLRVLQERTFERLGGMETRKTDVRIIAATHRRLEEMVENGTFRRDLYYRLNVFPLHLPALRERRNDILLLANHFVEKFAKRNVRGNVRLSLTVMDMLHRYDWPGNVRELENTMERAVLLVDKAGLVLPQHLPPEIHSQHCPTCGPSLLPSEGAFALRDSAAPYRLQQCSLQERLDELERASIESALLQSEGHLGHAAHTLGLTERVMALRMKKYKITYKNYRKESI